VNVITQYKDDSSDNDVSTNSVTSVTLFAGSDDNNDPDIQGMKVEFTTARRFVQVGLEGKRVCHNLPKVIVRCHLRERKMVSKVAVSKTHVEGKGVEGGQERAKGGGKKECCQTAEVRSYCGSQLHGYIEVAKADTI
jgi:hypothetical protein